MPEEGMGQTALWHWRQRLGSSLGLALSGEMVFWLRRRCQVGSWNFLLQHMVSRDWSITRSWKAVNKLSRLLKANDYRMELTGHPSEPQRNQVLASQRTESPSCYCCLLSSPFLTPNSLPFFSPLLTTSVFLPLSCCSLLPILFLPSPFSPVSSVVENRMGSRSRFVLFLKYNFYSLFLL